MAGPKLSVTLGDITSIQSSDAGAYGSVSINIADPRIPTGNTAIVLVAPFVLRYC